MEKEGIEKEEGIDYFNPAIVMAFLMALMSDAVFLTFLFWFVPVVGLVIAALVLGFHYFAGFFLLFLVLPRLKNFPPQLFLLIGILLPLPTLTLGIIMAIVFQNRIIEFIAKTAAIILAPEVAIPVITALEVTGAGVESLEKGEGVGKALEEVAISGAEAAAVSVSAAKAAKAAEAAKGAKAAEVAEKGVEVGARTGEVVGRKPSEVPEAEKEAKKQEVPPEAFGEKPEPEKELKQELFGGETGLDVPRPKKKSTPEEKDDEELQKAA